MAGWVDRQKANRFLLQYHYLGPARRGRAYMDEFGVAVFANPSSRRLPHDRWVELIRWCLVGIPNGGSQQWKRIVPLLRDLGFTTVVSYSDPSAGHTGALYRACNWQWAPTWHRLRPPPTGNGSWVQRKQQAVKDRWIFPLAKDQERASILQVQDDRLRRLYETGQIIPPWKVK